jgi:hypothetical protein
MGKLNEKGTTSRGNKLKMDEETDIHFDPYLMNLKITSQAQLKFQLNRRNNLQARRLQKVKK